MISPSSLFKTPPVLKEVHTVLMLISNNPAALISLKSVHRVQETAIIVHMKLYCTFMWN